MPIFSQVEVSNIDKMFTFLRSSRGPQVVEVILTTSPNLLKNVASILFHNVNGNNTNNRQISLSELSSRAATRTTGNSAPRAKSAKAEASRL